MKTKTMGVLLCLVTSYVVACTIEADVRSILTDVLLPFSGALTGMILATVGIVMGSVGSIYSAVAARHTQQSAQRVREALGKLDDMIRELREDCLLVVIGFSVLLACYLFSRMDLPGVAFPDCSWMGKTRAIITVSVFFTMLSLWAICDTVGAVFALHGHAAEIAREGKVGYGALSATAPTPQAVSRLPQAGTLARRGNRSGASSRHTAASHADVSPCPASGLKYTPSPPQAKKPGPPARGPG